MTVPNNLLPPNRTFDGTDNNPVHPRWGSVGERLVRLSTYAYADGVATPAGPNRPNARSISNTVCKQTRSIKDQRGLSDWIGVWALFLSHGFQNFRAAEPEEPFGISVPPNDPVFPPGTVIPVSRSAFDITTGRAPGNPRRQLVNTTSYLDASLVYGADASRSSVLRTFQNGKLKVSAGDLLPLNTFGLPNRVPGPNFFAAGDDRANTSFALCAVHTLFLREHNRLATEIGAAQPAFSDEQIFQRARHLVDGQIQSITYNEFLPALLGPHAPSGPVTYDTQVNATISELFSLVGFRFGHSLLSPRFVLRYANGDIRLVPQRNSFFNVELIKQDGIDPICLGLASQPMQKVDPQVIDDIRNQTIRFDVKIDLTAYDIQSGREVGIPDYSTTRQNLGLSGVNRFSDITSDKQTQHDLQAIYQDVHNIDPLIGGLAEDHLPRSSLGALFTRILVEQFERTRTGDRFWYEHNPALSAGDVNTLKTTTLADIIRRNTQISSIHDDVMFAAEPASALTGPMPTGSDEREPSTVPFR